MVNHQSRATDGDSGAAHVLTIKCVSGHVPISARVIMPVGSATSSPIVALHGISRDSDSVVGAFLEGNPEHRRIVIIPHFDKDHWPVFQRITGKHRPDLGLLAILGALRQDGIIGNEAFDLFGFSGGAQLAHRFAMLFPEKVNELHLGAAGWYTFPDNKFPYPLGLGPGGGTRKNWHRLMANGLPQYLNRPITVYVGDKDVQKDRSLRSDTLLNQVQGRNRLERAKRYVDFIGQRQADMDLPVTARLDVLPDCTHDFVMCCRNGELVHRVYRAGAHNTEL